MTKGSHLLYRAFKAQKMISKIFLFLVVFLYAFPAPIHSDDHLTVERRDDRVIYEIKGDEKKGSEKEQKESLEVLKGLNILIDRRNRHGEGEAHNR